MQVFYLQLTHGVVTVTDLQSIADQIDALWNTNIKPMAGPDCIMTNVDVVYISSVGNEITYTGSYTRTGTATGPTVQDASACYVINWKISAYYRGGHPRSYMPGVVTGAITNGSAVASTTRASLAAGWNAFRNSLNAFTTTNVTVIVMGTLSFQTGNAWRVTPLFRAYTSTAAAALLGSQRRRIRT